MSFQNTIRTTTTRILTCIIILLFSSALASCSSYSASFGCGDAKGAYCLPMDKVDKMVSSGEIERFTKEAERKSKCRGSGCVTPSNLAPGNQPPLLKKTGAPKVQFIDAQDSNAGGSYNNVIESNG